MAKEKNYKKMFEDFLDKMENYRNADDPDADAFVGWLETLEGNLKEAATDSLDSMPKECEKGMAEAFFTGLARFTCRIIERMERKGMFSEPGTGYDFYTKGLMPVCRDLVIRELDEEQELNDKTAALMADILDENLTDGDILRRHFSGRESEWPDIRQTLEEARQMAKGMKEKKD
jgi:hypothetical protein